MINNFIELKSKIEEYQQNNPWNEYVEKYINLEYYNTYSEKLFWFIYIDNNKPFENSKKIIYNEKWNVLFSKKCIYLWIITNVYNLDKSFFVIYKPILSISNKNLFHIDYYEFSDKKWNYTLLKTEIFDKNKEYFIIHWNKPIKVWLNDNSTKNKDKLDKHGIFLQYII